MCFPYRIKHNLVSKTWKLFVVLILLFTIFIWLVIVIVDFSYFAVVAEDL